MMKVSISGTMKLMKDRQVLEGAMATEPRSRKMQIMVHSIALSIVSLVFAGLYFARFNSVVAI